METLSSSPGEKERLSPRSGGCGPTIDFSGRSSENHYAGHGPWPWLGAQKLEESRKSGWSAFRSFSLNLEDFQDKAHQGYVGCIPVTHLWG